MNPDSSLVALARQFAEANKIDPTLVCAVIEQESAWDPRAIRYEGAFRARYVAPLGLPPTEEIARSISWGLMQVMGQVAREHGFTERFLSSLCEPAVGISVGCVVLASKIAAAGREVGAGNLSGSKVGCMSGCRTASLGVRHDRFGGRGFRCGAGAASAGGE